jgi:hypothetical protein
MMAAPLAFFPLAPGLEPPRRADNSADGTMPTRAYRYCEAMRLAAGAGCAVTAAADLDLCLDDHRQVLVRQPGEAWRTLTEEGEALPGLEETAAEAPPEARAAPAMVSRLREVGMVQLWTGWLVRCPAEHLVWMRWPANVPQLAGAHVWEGCVDASRVRPVFVNLTLASRGIVSIRRGPPLVQLVPVPAPALRQAPALLVAPLTPEFWAEYAATMIAPADGAGAVGDYAREQRKAARAGA